MNRFIWILIFLIALLFSGLYSGSETGMYQMSRLKLRLGVAQKKVRYKLLSRVMKSGNSFLISILIGNNLANYIATSLVTTYLVSKLTNTANVEIAAAAIIAPVLFIVGEVVPKNLFFFRADALMPAMAPVMYLSHKIFTFSGVVPLLQRVSEVLSRICGGEKTEQSMTKAQRHHLAVMLQETGEERVLSLVQRQMLERLLNINSIGVKSVMVPFSDVAVIDVESDRYAVINALRKWEFTRILVYEKQRDNVIGYLNIYQCLGKNDSFDNLRPYIRCIENIEAGTTVAETLNLMKAKGLKIAVVGHFVHGIRKIDGIVTMKDIVEEFVGELAAW
jgi:CBS domain containing-hemolysin-like protein